MIDMNIRKRLGTAANAFRLELCLRLPDDCRCAVLFGPSGSGKTLTLRALAGLLTQVPWHERHYQPGMAAYARRRAYQPDGLHAV